MVGKGQSTLPFKVGDVVRFKQGTTLMVVVSIQATMVECVFLPRSSGDRTVTIPVSMLEKH